MPPTSRHLSFSPRIFSERASLFPETRLLPREFGTAARPDNACTLSTWSAFPSPSNGRHGRFFLDIHKASEAQDCFHTTFWNFVYNNDTPIRVFTRCHPRYLLLDSDSAVAPSLGRCVWTESLKNTGDNASTLSFVWLSWARLVFAFGITLLFSFWEDRVALACRGGWFQTPG
jgi:hypothetical protein